ILGAGRGAHDPPHPKRLCDRPRRKGRLPKPLQLRGGALDHRARPQGPSGPGRHAGMAGTFGLRRGLGLRVLRSAAEPDLRDHAVDPREPQPGRIRSRLPPPRKDGLWRAGDQGELRGLIGLLSERFNDYAGGTRTERDPDPAYAGRVEELRSSLIEGIIQESEDEGLMDRYLSGEEIATKVLIDDLEKAVARGSFYPVLAVASPQGIGLAELLEVMTQAFPAPAEHPLPAGTHREGKPVTDLSCDPNGPLLAEVVKTASDPYVGRISLVRVFSGTLRPDAVVHVSGHGLAGRGHADHDQDERIG